MSEINTELASRLVTGRKRDGRCTYDPKAKAEIVQACLQPGVSVARIGIQYGINNLLRSWIGKRRDAAAVRPVGSAVRVNPSPVFVPLQIEAAKTQPAQAPVGMLKVHVRLPNGVEFDLSEARLEQLPPVIRVLSGLSCSSSSSR
jgi:transposase